ncbi:MAG: TIGR04255 family protein [Methanoculleus sp.]|uniref:TIGR04255 family protein n=1 Tax=Methanoculleus sp. TaxID=90427 RepID=UPI00261CE742|nr:TIGR04255 family protein [Methanoculleus sp.]MDD4314476.1 TIGR04255 family protein [Methanoculleus sp.]MDD4472134.1 TIGR04255 family protein [Methanoculleus sp.]
MSRYRNPPIVEAACEFRFSADTPWEQDLPERFYDAVKEWFPIRESRKEQAIRIKTGSEGIAENRLEKIEVPVFMAGDRKTLVQIGPRRLSIHRLKPYRSWEDFRTTINLAYSTIASLTNVTGFDRIGLLYVDKIEIPGNDVRLADYFTFYPHCGEGLPGDVMNFMVGCDFSYNGHRDICRLSLTRAMPERQNTSAYLLTTDYFLARRNTVEPKNALVWVEVAHTAVTALFEGCVTGKLEKIFNQDG